MRRLRSESGTVDIERTGSDISIDHADALIGKVQQHLPLEDLSLKSENHSVTVRITPTCLFLKSPS